MAIEDNLTDEQRAEQVRDWLSANGWYLLAGLVLGVAALFGYRSWISHGTQQAEQASAVYEELLSTVRAQRGTRAVELLQELSTNYKSTPYVDLGRLLVARASVDQGKPDEAIRYLREAAEGARSREIADVARLRLGRLLIQEEDFEEALKVLVPPRKSALAARYHDVRGDAYTAMGRNDDAAREYQEALEYDDIEIIDPVYIQAKLDEVVNGGPPGVIVNDDDGASAN